MHMCLSADTQHTRKYESILLMFTVYSKTHRQSSITDSIYALPQH